MTSDQKTAELEVDFDHCSTEWSGRTDEAFAGMRNTCPVAHTSTHGGFWMALGYDEVVAAARDDVVFSSQNDLTEERPGVAIPPMPDKSGILETDPPRSGMLRKAFLPWFSPAAAQARREQVQQIADYCIDQVIERGECDFTNDIAAPIPALLTMQFLGFPASESMYMSDLMHRHAYLSPNTPERDEMQRQMGELRVQIEQALTERRAEPREDFLSFVANVEIDGAPLPMPEAVDNAWLVISGGVDTTTALLSHTFVHLTEHPEYRQRLLDEPGLLVSAFDEFLRYYNPVQGLGRTVTRDVELGGQALAENDRIWLLWASANHDPNQFEAPDEFRIDRSPNRHVSFGIGSHRCIGANVAQVTWSTIVLTVLRRMPDLMIDIARSTRYPAVPVINGWIATPATFTPGPRVGAELPSV
jgi:cytochrome P450